MGSGRLSFVSFLVFLKLKKKIFGRGLKFKLPKLKKKNPTVILYISI